MIAKQAKNKQADCSVECLVNLHVFAFSIPLVPVVLVVGYPPPFSFFSF